MTEPEKLAAAELAYEAYRLSFNGMREGKKLKAWVDLSSAEKTAQVAAVTATETYITSLGA